MKLITKPLKGVLKRAKEKKPTNAKTDEKGKP